MRWGLLAVLAFAGMAAAHTGVKNPAVLERMENMTAMGAELKVLGEMVKGATPLDPAKARAATVAIADHASETVALFEAPEEDPMSESKPNIWTEFDEFSALSNRLEVTARQLSEALDTEDDLTAALKTIGDACKACHEPYRE